MSSIYYNPKTPGQLGRVILRRIGNKVFYARGPVMRGVPLSPAQAAHRLRFKEATAYARAIFGHPARLAPYQAAADARGPGTNVFSGIVGEFLKNPLLRAVETGNYHGQVGDPIAIRVREDIAMSEVLVSLRRADYTPIENGAAVLDNGAFRYVATQAVPLGTEVVADVTLRDSDDLELKRSVTFVVA